MDAEQGRAGGEQRQMARPGVCYVLVESGRSRRWQTLGTKAAAEFRRCEMNKSPTSRTGLTLGALHTCLQLVLSLVDWAAL